MLMAVVVAMVLILAALAAVFLFYPVVYGSDKPIHLARHKDRVAMYDARSRELVEENASGRLSAADYQSLQQELDRQILAETGVAEQTLEVKGRLNWQWSLTLVAAMAVIASALYWPLGARPAVELYDVVQASDRSDADFDQYLSALETYVEGQSSPSIENLYMLAEGYSETGRYAEAVAYYDRVETALRRLAEYDPEELSAVIGNRGQVRFVLSDRELTPAVEADFAEALRLDPLNSQALATLGVAHFDAGNYDEAITVWQRYLEVAPSGSMREGVLGALEQARRITGDLAPDATEPPGVQVLFSALPDDLHPEALVYIVARPVGEDLPVAIQRYEAGDMPLALRLTDRDRTGEMAALSSHAEVDVVAFATPPGATDLTQASHRTGVVRSPTDGDDAVVTLTLTGSN